MNRLTKYQQTEGGIPFVDVEDNQEALQLLARYEDIGTVEELTKYKQAKADGRLVILPCKVGIDCGGMMLNSTSRPMFFKINVVFQVL